jgi:hypothetical protein
MPEPALRWLEDGSPPLPRRGRGFDQEGTGSCLRGRAGNGVMAAERAGQVLVPAASMAPENEIQRVRAGPPVPPHMAVRHLNFVVFEEIYRHCAYDSVAFGCFFLCSATIFWVSPCNLERIFLLVVTAQSHPCHRQRGPLSSVVCLRKCRNIRGPTTRCR